MASIIKRTEDVAAACREALEWIESYRKTTLQALVDTRMKETKFSFRQFKRVPKYQTQEQVIEALKKEQDFFGNTYVNIMNSGSRMEYSLKRLLGMCKHAGVIRITSEDYELIRAEL